MPQAHICNAFFEKELEIDVEKSLINWIRSHPILLQLQFLPLLYAKPNDWIFVSDLPENPDARLCLIDDPPNCSGTEIVDWGPSRSIATWAKKHRFLYPDYNWKQVRELNSKIFSFSQTPPLPGASLLNTQAEVQAWLNATTGPKVLKKPFGTAGNGHILNPDEKQLYSVPLIGEPWVERLLDFSTQWKEGELQGVTLFENFPNGTYKGTFKGEVEPWALREHLKVAEPLIKKIPAMGYSGHIGIDAFIYLWKGENRLHPVVEINGRKTMSWIALQIANEKLNYIPTKTGLLPNTLIVKGKKIAFTRNVVLAKNAV